MHGGWDGPQRAGNRWRMTEIDVPAVLLRINRDWQPGMGDAQVYDVVHGWWVMGQRREQAEYALAVAGGVIRGAYRVRSWRQRREGDRGWEEDPEQVRCSFHVEPGTASSSARSSAGASRPRERRRATSGTVCSSVATA